MTSSHVPALSDCWAAGFGLGRLPRAPVEYSRVLHAGWFPTGCSNIYTTEWAHSTCHACPQQLADNRSPSMRAERFQGSRPGVLV